MNLDDKIFLNNPAMLDPRIHKILQEHLNDLINTISSMPSNKYISEQEFFKQIKSNTEKAKNCFECIFCRCEEINSKKKNYTNILV